MSAAWQPRTLGQVFAASVAAHGPREALVTDRKRFTYAEFETEVLEAARALHALGIRKGEHIAILMGNTPAWVKLFFGAALLGAVTVPVNTRFKAAELGFCLKQADVKALFLDSGFMNIDFVAFLREVEPRIDTSLPGIGLPLLEHVTVMGEGVPQAAIGWRNFLKLGEAVDVPWRLG